MTVLNSGVALKLYHTCDTQARVTSTLTHESNEQYSTHCVEMRRIDVAPPI